jgi:hypothetical protein
LRHCRDGGFAQGRYLVAEAGRVEDVIFKGVKENKAIDVGSEPFLPSFMPNHEDIVLYLVNYAVGATPFEFEGSIHDGCVIPAFGRDWASGA